MNELRKPRNYWTKERCQEESLKYDRKIDFITNKKTTYQAAYRKGFLDDICKHMKILGDKYNRCIYSYEFSDKHVYIGLTFNLEKRHNYRLLDKKDPVTKHYELTKLIPIRKQLTEDLEEG